MTTESKTQPTPTPDSPSVEYLQAQIRVFKLIPHSDRSTFQKVETALLMILKNLWQQSIRGTATNTAPYALETCALFLFGFFSVLRNIAYQVAVSQREITLSIERGHDEPTPEDSRDAVWDATVFEQASLKTDRLHLYRKKMGLEFDPNSDEVPKA